MKVQILGSAAGGGVPQWNCRCPNCQAARQPHGSVAPRTQSSVAVSRDGLDWFLLNVSADVRQQINGNPGLWPPAAHSRGTTIAGCLLTDAEIDHASGLLQLREGCRFDIYGTDIVRRWLTEDLPIARILTNYTDPTWIELTWDAPTELRLSSGLGSGLSVVLVDVGHDVPRYARSDQNPPAGSVVGLLIRDEQTQTSLVYAPGVPELTTALTAAAEQADAILLDGTFWSDDEPQRMGISTSSARQMGHVPVDGPSGTLEWLANVEAQHRMYVHINNTNPMLNYNGPEHERVRQRGIRVGRDGEQFSM